MIASTMTIGEQVRIWRRAKGLGQQDLAQLSQLSVATISKLENDRHESEASTVRAVAEALGHTFEELQSAVNGQDSWTISEDSARRLHELMTKHPKGVPVAELNKLLRKKGEKP